MSVQTWCVPSAACVPCVYWCHNKVLNIRAFNTIFSEASFYFQKLITLPEKWMHKSYLLRVWAVSHKMAGWNHSEWEVHPLLGKSKRCGCSVAHHGRRATQIPAIHGPNLRCAQWVTSSHLGTHIIIVTNAIAWHDMDVFRQQKGWVHISTHTKLDTNSCCNTYA
jgi:hypothetical protein